MQIHWKDGRNFRADFILFQHFSKINYADYIGKYDNFSLGRKKRKKDYKNYKGVNNYEKIYCF